MRALVVGLGRMGGFHANVLRDLGYEVVTVDPDPSKGADYLSLPDDAFAVACVATPIALLCETAAEVAVTYAPEFLLIEKPMAPAARDWRRHAAAIVRVPHVAVGYVERFNPVIQRLIEDATVGEVEAIEFTRLNDRPTPDARIDLWSHDLDLSMYLTARGVNTADVRFRVDGDMPHRVRCIQVTYTMGTVSYDLMDHSENPLRLQWEAFLAGDSRVATPEDALRVLRTIESTSTMEIAA